MLKFGFVSEVKPGFARVNFAQDGIVTDFLPVMVRKSKTDKESWQLEINEHVVCFMEVDVIDGKVYESCDVGVILGVIPSDQDAPDPGEGPGKFRKKFSDGTVIEYDKESHELTTNVQGKLKATVTGDAELSAGGKASVSASQIEATASGTAKVTAPDITLQGNVSINGTLNVAGNISGTGTATLTGILSAAGISAGGASMSSGTLTIPGDVIVAGKSMIGHTHTAPGGTTGPPL